MFTLNTKSLLWRRADLNRDRLKQLTKAFSVMTLYTHTLPMTHIPDNAPAIVYHPCILA